MKDRLYKQDFFCYSCDKKIEKIAWESKLYETKCDCGSILEPVFFDEKEVKFSILQKMTKQEIKKDRLKRSREHFKNEIYPTLSKKDKKFFDNRKK